MNYIPYFTLFDYAVNWVMDREGPYHVDHNDPGGATAWGISKRYHPTVDIANLTRDQAAGIYRNEYWTPNGCDNLPGELAMVHFDSCVNPGAGVATLFLAKANGDFESYLLQRVFWYNQDVQAHSNLKEYLSGWLNRCELLYRAVS